MTTAALNHRGRLLGSTSQAIGKYTAKLPTLPNSRKAEGTKHLQVLNTYLCSQIVRSLKDQNRLKDLENELSETRFKWNIIDCQKLKDREID